MIGELVKKIFDFIFYRELRIIFNFNNVLLYVMVI